MTPTEHAAEADRYLKRIEELNEPGGWREQKCIQLAQIHATLALAKMGIMKWYGPYFLDEGGQ